MRKQNLYQITVERKVRERHTVIARTRTEAAVKFAGADFESLDEVTEEVVDERVMTPRLIKEGFDPNQMTIDEALAEADAVPVPDDDAGYAHSDPIPTDL